MVRRSKQNIGTGLHFEQTLELSLIILSTFLVCTFTFVACLIFNFNLNLQIFLCLFFLSSMLILHCRKHKYHPSSIILTFLGLMLSSFIISLYPLEDFSADSVSIYRNAQEQIQRGWNFLEDPRSEEFRDLNRDQLWSNAEYVSAAAKLPYAVRHLFYGAFGESSTLLSNFFFFIVLLLIFLKGTTISRFRGKFAKLVVTCSLLSPTIVSQFSSYYADYHIAILSTILCVCILELSYENVSDRERKHLNSVALLSLGLLLLAKLSGFLSTIVLGLLWLAISIDKKDFKIVRRNSHIFSFVCACSLALWQFAHNLKIFGDPLFPVGKSTSSVLQGGANGFFFEKPYIGFFKSIFGIPSVANSSLMAPQWIFDAASNVSVTSSAIAALGRVDTRVSGFGILFGFAYLAAIFVSVLTLKKSKFKDSLSAATLLMLVTIPNIPGSYWSRLIIYLFPIVWITLVRNMITKSLTVSIKSRIKVKPGLVLSIFAANAMISMLSSQILDYKDYTDFRNFIKDIRTISMENRSVWINSRNQLMPNLIRKEFPLIRLNDCNDETAILSYYETNVCAEP